MGVFENCRPKEDYKYKLLDKKPAEQIIREKWENLDEFGYQDEFTADHIIKYAHDNGISPGDFIPAYDDFYCQVVPLLRTDDQHRFERLINSTDPDIIEKFPGDGLFELVCKHNAVACAAVLLQYDFEIRVRSGFIESDYYPLNYGALHRSPALTQLLLQHDAKPDSADKREFPLDTALDNLCLNEYVKLWTKDKSIFKLLYILCLPELKEALDTIKLLASNMKHADKVYGDIVKRGDVCKLASLLIAAKDQLLVPSAKGGLETTPIGKYILENLRAESEQERQSVGHLVYQHKFRVERITDAYNVAKILWKAVNVLDCCRTSEWIENVPNYVVPFYIANDLVNNAKLVLNPKDVYCDDIKCLQPPITITSKAEVIAKRICLKKQLSSSSILPLLVGVHDPGMGMSLLLSSSITTSNDTPTSEAVNFNRIKPVKIEITHVKPSSCNVVPLVMKPAMSITGTSQFPSSSMSNYPHRTYHICQAIKPMGIQLSRYTQIKQSVHNPLASRTYATLIWMVKRSIK